MTRRMLALAALLSAVFSPALAAHADPGIRHEIAELTEALERAPRALHLRLARAEMYVRIRETDAAFADLAVAESIAPGEPRVRVLRAEAFLALGRTADARTELESVVTTARGRGAMEAFATLARLDEREGRTEDAVARYDGALENGDEVELYLERGRLLVRLGRIDEAIRGYETGVQVLGGAALLRAEIVPLLLRAGRAREALSHADALVGSARARARFLVLRAEVHTALGDAARARRDREAALADAERMVERRGAATAYEERGRALLALGRAAEAERDLTRATRLAPRSISARRLLQEARTALGGAR